MQDVDESVENAPYYCIYNKMQTSKKPINSSSSGLLIGFLILVTEHYFKNITFNTLYEAINKSLWCELIKTLYQNKYTFTWE